METPPKPPAPTPSDAARAVEARRALIAKIVEKDRAILRALSTQ
jgi:hypothetical protein